MSQPNNTPKSAFLLDTGPLSVLCGFPARNTPYIHTILDYVTIALSDGVETEIQKATKGKIARTVIPLIKTGDIATVQAPAAPTIVDAAYSRDLGIGERSTIRAALATGLPVVLDDKTAFIVACRFGLHPVGFQDFIVQLAKEHGLSKQVAIEIVKATSKQYPAMYLMHTLDMLKQES